MGVLLPLAMLCLPLGILAAETVWYVPGWLRCGSPDEKVLAELRLAFPQANVVFRDWDGNGLWGDSVRNADLHAQKLLRELERLTPADRASLTLVGHSLGGRTTVRLLAAMASRGLSVRRAILLGAAIPYTDRDLTRMTAASQEPVLNLCNPEDVTLRYLYTLFGGEPAPALGANGTTYRLDHYIEKVVPQQVVKDVSFGSPLKDLQLVKQLAQHHALFYANWLRRVQSGQAEPSSSSPLVPQGAVNLRLGVMDAKIWWEVLDARQGWQLQRNHLTGLCRILNPDGQREAWGDETTMRRSFRKVLEQLPGQD